MDAWDSLNEASTRKGDKNKALGYAHANEKLSDLRLI